MMMRALLMYTMALEASFDGIVFVEGALPHSEVAQRIKEAMEPSRDDVGVEDLIPGYPRRWN